MNRDSTRTQSWNFGLFFESAPLPTFPPVCQTARFSGCASKVLHSAHRRKVLSICWQNFGITKVVSKFWHKFPYCGVRSINCQHIGQFAKLPDNQDFDCSRWNLRINNYDYYNRQKVLSISWHKFWYHGVLSINLCPLFARWFGEVLMLVSLYHDSHPAFPAMRPLSLIVRLSAPRLLLLNYAVRDTYQPQLNYIIF